MPLVVITSQPQVAAQCNLVFGQQGFLVDASLMEDSAPAEIITR